MALQDTWRQLQSQSSSSWTQHQSGLFLGCVYEGLQTQVEILAVGDLISFATPNGGSHGYTYDSHNRLTNLAVGTTTTPLASYAYTLDAAGHRTGVTELGESGSGNRGRGESGSAVRRDKTGML